MKDYESPIEVFVNGTRKAGSEGVQEPTNGHCPFSHRVLITLKEMGIPYKLVMISPDAKPPWYYQLHPGNKTPCIYHDGNVIEESSNILSYLVRQFPTSKHLASSENLQVARSTPGYTKFYPYFVKWMKGHKSARKSGKRITPNQQNIRCSS